MGRGAQHEATRALAYATPPPAGRRVPWLAPLAVAAGAAGVYWRFADWYAYGGTGAGAWPKFPMPWWWQIGESAFVGAAFAAASFFIYVGLRRPWRHWSHRLKRLVGAADLIDVRMTDGSRHFAEVP